MDCCFSELALLKIQLSVSGLEQNGPYHHLVENKLVLAMNINHSFDTTGLDPQSTADEHTNHYATDVVQNV
jgi:hypothetical protein